jgi:hypothetical protein
MARDDSLLYTGATSASFKSRKEDIHQEKIEKKGAITPAAKVVLDFIEQEKVNVCDIRSLVLDRTTDEEDIKAELLARKLYTAYLSELQNKLKIILRTKPHARTPRA